MTRKLPLIALLTAAALHAAPAPHATAAKPTGAQVFTLTQQLVQAAPKRFANSPGHLAAENFIKSHFQPEIKSGQFQQDDFAPATPIGRVAMHNFIVKYPGKKDGLIVLASHYETNYPLKDINFVGANDGACTSAMLIALGDYYRAHPPEGYSVWLVFDDGEEAIKEWSAQDSLYGTRHLAAKWSGEGVLAKIKAFIVLDMIGDKDLNIDNDINSTPALEALLKQAAKNTNHAAFVFKNNPGGIDDDHIPFKQRGVPVLDLIDIEYGPPTSEHPEGSYHHTTGDTLDHISGRSLQISLDLLFETMRLINEH